MDRRTVIRDKLAELTTESARHQTGWRYGAGRSAQEVWRRFGALSVLEKCLIAAGSVLAVIIIPVVVFALTTQGGGSGSTAAHYTRPTSTAAAVVSRPTSNGGPTSTPFLVTVRRNCDLIKGSDYRSDAERQWYQENCTESTPTPRATPTPTERRSNPPPGGGGPPPPPPPPAPTPSPDTLTADEAILLAANWMVNQAGPAYYVIDGSCSSVSNGSHFVVSCSLALQGCQTAVCAETHSACVYDNPARVVPASQC